MTAFDRITLDPSIMSGHPCIRDTRVTVTLVLNLVADGMNAEQIIETHPSIERDDISQALRCAALLAEENPTGAIWTDMDRLAAEIGAHWPANVAATEAVRDVRRD